MPDLIRLSLRKAKFIRFDKILYNVIKLHEIVVLNTFVTVDYYFNVNYIYKITNIIFYKNYVKL